MRTMLRIGLRLLLMALLMAFVAACGGDALRECEETVSDIEARNQVLEEALASSETANQDLQEVLSRSQDEKQQLQEDLAQGQDENQDLQQTVEQSQAENQGLQDALAQSQDANQQLQDTLAKSQDENQELQQDLADALAETERLREEIDQAVPDLSWVRERLWLLFHDQSPAVWECDDTASQVVPVIEMTSASPAEMVEQINDRFQELNPEYESPGLVLAGMDGDTAIVSLARANVVTEQMGSTGAQCYFAGVTFSLTSFEAIDHVRFDIKEGSHGSPGRYDRADFVFFLPLEEDQP